MRFPLSLLLRTPSSSSRSTDQPGPPCPSHGGPGPVPNLGLRVRSIVFSLCLAAGPERQLDRPLRPHSGRRAETRQVRIWHSADNRAHHQKRTFSPMSVRVSRMPQSIERRLLDSVTRNSSSRNCCAQRDLGGDLLSSGVRFRVHSPSFERRLWVTPLRSPQWTKCSEAVSEYGPSPDTTRISQAPSPNPTNAGTMRAEAAAASGPQPRGRGRDRGPARRRSRRSRRCGGSTRPGRG